MNKEINNNGYDYVDLDLPSGTLWATCNVGANKPTDYGLYFQWGDIIGYTADEVGTLRENKKFALDWGDYKWNPSGDGKSFIKYTNAGFILDILELEDDAAHVHMGGDWHIPTPYQIQELIDNTTSIWRALNGVNGMTFTSKKDPSKSIFIPAAGDAFNGSISLHRYAGCIWTSMLNVSFSKDAQTLFFTEGGAYLNDYCFRCHGVSVRGVIDKNSDISKDKKNNMKEELNLVEILKNVPSGTKLWSPICGECELVEIDSENTHPIICRTKTDGGDIGCETFTADGNFFCDYKNGECLLFPSKENRDWSTFKVSKGHKHFEPYQKVLIKDKFMSKYFWVAAVYSHFDALTNKHYLVGADWAEDDEIISYKGNEDKLGKIII